MSVLLGACQCCCIPSCPDTFLATASPLTDTAGVSPCLKHPARSPRGELSVGGCRNTPRVGRVPRHSQGAGITGRQSPLSREDKCIRFLFFCASRETEAQQVGGILRYMQWKKPKLVSPPSPTPVSKLRSCPSPPCSWQSPDTWLSGH